MKITKETLEASLSQASQKEQPKPERNTSSKLMLNLWERLNHIYGHKFSATYGVSAFNEDGLTEAARTWASGLSGISGEQVANGLRECIDCGEAWPPTLPEFVSMCKGKALNRFGLDYIPECYREEPILDKSRLLSSDQIKASEEAGKAELNRMREKLGMKPKE